MNNTEYQTAGVIQIRLDTTPLLNQLEAFYRGTRIVGYKEDNGVVEPVFSTMGEPKMNERGIQQMMSWLSTIFNPQTVQGNKKDEDYRQFMERLEKDLSDDLMVNLINYGIREEDYQSIINMTINAADMFFSRTIDNKERESYSATMRSVERVGENKGLIEQIIPFRRKH